MEESYDLVLFDLDGTLSDPLVGIGRLINYAQILEMFGLRSFFRFVSGPRPLSRKP
jgi:phosphoglycolate phosphatase-like HAD superfamily hydrolase